MRYAQCCEIPVSKPMDMMNLSDYIEMGRKMSGMGKMMKEYGKISIEDLGNRFKDPLLKRLMTDYMYNDYLAYFFVVGYATIASGNGNVPIKGSLAMTNRIIERYRELGGTLITNAPVKKININKGKSQGTGLAHGIELADGRMVKADHVICATDTAEVFYSLVDEVYIDARMKKCYDDRGDYPVFSGFQMAFSIDCGIISGEVICFDCKPFKAANRNVGRMSVKNYGYDPSFAPEGKVVLQCSLLQLEDDFAYWKSLDKQSYKQEKQKVADNVLKRIVEQFPDLRDSIQLLDVWTPLTYTRYCNSFCGAYMGFIGKKGVKSYKFKENIKGLSNVWVASQWMQSPGGLPVAAASGRFVIQRILKQQKKSYDF